mmetsp:Transcript_65102/g.187312  ORF Transcript_65102/g.187312 Transcript_65102/m.187312 type:complete len:265 (+) Transcript_65102:1790-2584(+)
MRLLDLCLLGTELCNVFRQGPRLDLRNVQGHRFRALRDGSRRGALDGAVLPSRLEDPVGVLPGDLLLCLHLQGWRRRLSHLNGFLLPDDRRDHLLGRQILDLEHGHRPLRQMCVDLNDQRLSSTSNRHVDRLEVHPAQGNVVSLEEAEQLLPIVISARCLRAVLERVHRDVLGRVVPREDLRDKEAVREIALRVAHAVGQIQALQPLQNLTGKRLQRFLGSEVRHRDSVNKMGSADRPVRIPVEEVFAVPVVVVYHTDVLEVAA